VALITASWVGCDIPAPMHCTDYLGRVVSLTKQTTRPATLSAKDVTQGVRAKHARVTTLTIGCIGHLLDWPIVCGTALSFHLSTGAQEHLLRKYVALLIHQGSGVTRWFHIG
jgi:hypothetical protein